MYHSICYVHIVSIWALYVAIEFRLYLSSGVLLPDFEVLQGHLALTPLRDSRYTFRRIIIRQLGSVLPYVYRGSTEFSSFIY
jgi:hypothetical protein